MMETKRLSSSLSLQYKYQGKPALILNCRRNNWHNSLFKRSPFCFFSRLLEMEDWSWKSVFWSLESLYQFSFLIDWTVFFLLSLQWITIVRLFARWTQSSKFPSTKKQSLKDYKITKSDITKSEITKSDITSPKLQCLRLQRSKLPSLKLQSSELQRSKKSSLELLSSKWNCRIAAFFVPFCPMIYHNLLYFLSFYLEFSHLWYLCPTLSILSISNVEAS